MEKVLVSICCITYNHEKYIADALEGFLNQKGNFDIEIIIHDDASKDKTQEIIRRYAEKYPNIIKPIYQLENQYSQGISIMDTYVYERATGKYIAVCEGDDYWIDEYKLEKQVKYMEENPQCTFCFTNGKIRDESGKRSEREFIPYAKENIPYFFNCNKMYDMGELAVLGFIPTASFLFPKKIFESLPDFYYKKFPVEDIKIKLIAASKGYAYLINDFTILYRENVKNSATTQWKICEDEKLITVYQGYVDLIDLIDEYTNLKHHDKLNQIKISFEFNKKIAMKDKNIFFNKRYRMVLKHLNMYNKMRLIASVYFPNTYRFIKKKMKNT